MPVTSYKMKTNGATLGRVSNIHRDWKPGQVFRVPEDVPEGEFDHLGGGDYEATVEAEEGGESDAPKEIEGQMDVQTRPAKGTTRPAK